MRPSSSNQNHGIDPEELRPASTVILVREHETGFQVYLLKRSGQSRFFPGSYVFPGGTVASEDRNADLWLRHSDLDLPAVERRLGGTLAATEALAHAVAAIRETFEEGGVLLAARARETTLGVQAICETRKVKKLSKGWFGEWAVSGGWFLQLSRLAPWTHWITPKMFKPRFDTRFFVASVPEGQECSPDKRETVHGTWVTPEQGLAGNLKGEIPLSPPTLVTLHELLRYKTPSELKDESGRRGWGGPRLPRVIPVERGAVILEPWDPMIHDKDLVFDSGTLKERILTVSEPFSRLWLHEGIWRPVGL